LRHALEALVCKELGFPDLVSMDELKDRVLSRIAGSSETLNKKDIEIQVPRAAVGARRSGTQELRKAILRQWVCGGDNGQKAAVPNETGTEPKHFDLGDFAATIKAIARECPDGWFGDSKVFINHVWRYYGIQEGLPRMELPEFKAWLVRANQARLLDLSRADLPDQLPMADVAESETIQENALFHFVQAERRCP
jgi:hypothetical protein